MMLHHNAAIAAASRASGKATNADFHRSVAVVIIALLLLLLLCCSQPVRPSDVAVAEHWAANGWSSVTARATVLVTDRTEAAPDLAMLRQDLDPASLVASTSWSSRW